MNSFESRNGEASHLDVAELVVVPQFGWDLKVRVENI